jgi:glucose-6-phosphate 1-dehydrogenase
MTLPLEPTILVIFGSMGDLTWRKLAASLYNLLLGGQLPEHFAVIGLNMKNASPDEF